MTTYTVYWIHYEIHKDPYTEGYVGITNNVERRLKEHRSSKINTQLAEAVRQNAILTVLQYNLSLQDAARAEYNYRNKKYIGWNIAAGGKVPPDVTGIKRSPETKLKMSLWQIGGKHSAERRLANSQSHLGVKKGPMSEEHKKKLSQSHLGVKKGPMSEEQKRKISQALLGRKRSEVAKVKITCVE